MLGTYSSASAGSRLLVAVVLAISLELAVVAVAQDVPAVPSAAPPAPSFASKCTSCIGSLGGMLSSSKKHCCNSPLGSLINGAFQPLKFATGGVIPSPCPGPNEPSHKPGGGGAGGAGGAAAGPPGPQQAAEAIKQDQAQAKARAQAVRYLATVPCHYYPEAEVALITALRTDRNECVRWEAAHALAQGCCCTKRIIEALKITIEGSQKDSNPRELSVRVRVEAMNALQHCLATCGDTVESPQRPEMPTVEPEPIPAPVPSRRPEVPAAYNGNDAKTNGGVQLASYYDRVGKQSTPKLLAEARKLVQSVRPVLAGRVESPPGKSLYELWQRASEPAAVARSAVVPSAAASIGMEPNGAESGAPTMAAIVAPKELDQREQPRRLPPVSVLPEPALPRRPERLQSSPPHPDGRVWR